MHRPKCKPAGFSPCQPGKTNNEDAEQRPKHVSGQCYNRHMSWSFPSTPPGVTMIKHSLSLDQWIYAKSTLLRVFFTFVLSVGFVNEVKLVNHTT